MFDRRKIETDFYLFAKMAGIQKVKANQFVFEENLYTINAYATPELAALFGGRRRAYRLLRHARMIQLLCTDLGQSHVFGVVDQSFDRVSGEYPFLRSYYEASRVGGLGGAWVE